MAARVRILSPGIQQLLRSQDVRTFLHLRGERVAAHAAATAPRDTGTFADSFAVVDDTTDRAVCRITTNDPKGAVKEARFRTLTRSLDQAR